MRTAHREVAAFAAERGIDLRTAALALAIGRVVEANAKLGRMADPAEAGSS